MARLSLIALLSLAFVLSACDHSDSPSPGALEVSWRVKGTLCGDAGVASVRITLTLDGAVFKVAEAACTDSIASFVDVPSGRYEILIEGLDEDGATTYSGGPVEVTVPSSGEAIADRIELERIGGALNLLWSFDNGMLCSVNQIIEVEVAVWGNGRQEYGAVYPCDPFSDAQTEEGVSLQPGVLISQLEADEVEVKAFGLDADGLRLFYGTIVVVLEQGRVVNASIKMESCNGVCG